MPNVFVSGQIVIGNRVDFWVVYGVLSCCPKILFNEFASAPLVNQTFRIVFQVCNCDKHLQFQGFTGVITVVFCPLLWFALDYFLVKTWC